ncbi:MAG: hypothetical protein IJG05_03915, partial [Solobacterium sp.]|nr:hypothetical protein [Solobacterium sp.]
MQALDHADICVKNVHVFNSYFKAFFPADIYIKDGRFLYIDRKRCSGIRAAEEVDGAGKYMSPGLIDIHMQIESSL